MATYLYIDVDAFLAAVEQALNPELRGRPVMVGGLKNERGIVYCASYEARRKGVRMGTSLYEAARLIPDGAFLRGDWNTYEQYSERLMDILSHFCYALDQISPDEACLNITGMEKHFGNAGEIARRIKKLIREKLQLSTSVGIASSRVVAKIASEIVKPDNLTIVPEGGEIDFLAPLPVGKIPGIGRVGRKVLGEMGVKSIGQLRRIPENYLITLFGQNGRKFASYAAGQDGPLIRDFSAIRSVNRETGLAEDITDRDILLGHYYYLLERACRRLRQICKKAQRMTLKFRYNDFEQVEGHISIRPPGWDEKVFYQHAVRMFDTLFKRRKGIRFVGVNLNGLKNAAYAESFILDGTEKKERLLASIDNIRGRFGFLAVTTGRTIMLNRLYQQRISGYELRTPGLSQ